MMFSWFIASSFAAEPVTALPNEFNCYLVETALLDSNDTFTGRCDDDFEFVDAPRPETIWLALEDQRGALDQCIRLRYGHQVGWNGPYLGHDNSYELTIVMVVDDTRVIYDGSGK